MTALDRTDYRAEKLAILAAEFDGAPPQAILNAALTQLFTFEELALVTSFGTESAVLLHMAAQIDPGVRVISIDTGKLFGETRRYRDRLVTQLGLTNLTVISPRDENLKVQDPSGTLWAQKPDHCCYWRKVEPLDRALGGVDVWISGRKRYQAASRSALPVFELADGRIKVNPLAGWTREDLTAYFDAHQLPRHPLEADGYLSIGCMPCTDRVAPGEDARAGRWRGIDKTECGIHMPHPAPDYAI
ncbi:MAG: phosphoadenylyl-sulfate reductase [Rhodothalassiaceae bacterium]